MFRESLIRRVTISATLVNWIFAIFLLIFGVVYLILSLNLPEARLSDPVGHKAFPLIIASVLVALGIGMSLKTLWDNVNAQRSVESKEDSAEAVASYPFAVLACAAYLLVFFFLLERIGFILSSIIFLLPMMITLNRQGWITNGAVAILFPTLIYVVFTQLLGVRLPRFPLF